MNWKKARTQIWTLIFFSFLCTHAAFRHFWKNLATNWLICISFILVNLEHMLNTLRAMHVYTDLTDAYCTCLQKEIFLYTVKHICGVCKTQVCLCGCSEPVAQRSPLYRVRLSLALTVENMQQCTACHLKSFRKSTGCVKRHRKQAATVQDFLD